MRILDGQNLVNALNEIARQVEKRLWIATPFLGTWSGVRRILGKKWFNDPHIDVRLLTDISNTNGIAPETYEYFRERAVTKTLLGLHAKIYIADDQVIVTSANLTRTAFIRRREIGILLAGTEANAVTTTFLRWWNNYSKEIREDWRPLGLVRRQNNSENEREDAAAVALEDLFNLPDDPGNPRKNVASTFLDYNHFIAAYKEVADIYAKRQRIWPNSPLFLEVDSFFNFLFHEADETPSNVFLRRRPRVLSPLERRNEIARYAQMFNTWVRDGNETQWRDRSSRIITKILRQDRIDNISKANIEKVVDQLNCMTSNALNRYRFMNPRNNDIRTIRSAWKELLYDDGPLIKRMHSCNMKLNYFGKSSIQELVGYFDPEHYPLRNRNVNAGLRFFGYNIAVY